MNKLFFVTMIATIGLAGTSLALPGIGSAELKAAAATEPAESTVPELSKIVVLCAQDEKKKFEKEWSKYVSKHELKGAKLEETIAWVSEKAASQRKKSREKADAKQDEEWLEERRRLMSEIADKALNPAR